SGPVVEFFFPLFINCLLEPLLTGLNIPNSTSNLIITRVSDQNGFTKTNTALYIAKFFPLNGVSCQVIVSKKELIDLSSTIPVDLGIDNRVIPIEFIT
ncbi:hypothetical protein V2W45_1208196, partial [Cenococcum geophilum]